MTALDDNKDEDTVKNIQDNEEEIGPVDDEEDE